MQLFQLRALGPSIDLQIVTWILIVPGIIVGTMLLGRWWRKKNLRRSQTTRDVAAEQEPQLATDQPQQKLEAVDAEKTSQGTIDPAETPTWYLEHATQHHREAERQLNSKSDPSKVILFHRQCKYLAEHLGTTIESSRKSLNRSLSPEHRAECRSALKLLCRLAKEVESFVGECCNEKTWVQAALTPGTVPGRVSSWRWHLKVCTELLCNSNKLGAAWLTIAQHGGLGEAELLAIEKMASDDEDDLMRLLESMLAQSSELQPRVFMGNVELVSILLERLKARQARSTVGSPQSSFREDTDGMRKWKIDSKALRQLGLLGRGSSNSVFKGEWFGEMKVAVKDYSGSGDTSQIKQFEFEVALVARLPHPNIVSFLGYTLEEGSCFQILELMDGDLRTLMVQRMQEDGNREGPFSIWEACDIMLQVAEGVRYMHQNRVLHRDLKSANILVRSSKDEDGNHVCAKVWDFGLSKRIDNSITYSEQSQNMGTYRWMAPELMKLSGSELSNSTYDGLKHPFKSDVYSFGILCYEILTGESPFSSISSPRGVKSGVLKGVRPTLPEKSPQSVRNLIKLCWDPEPITRPSFAEICKELRYIRFSLLLEPQDCTPQLPLPILEPLHLPPQVSKFKGEYASLKVVRKLGTGGSDMATLYSSTWLQPGNEVAQKRYMGSHNECFKNEVSIMAGLEHSNVVRLLRYASDRRSCSIVMELMDEDLHNLMHRRRSEGKVTPTGPFSMADAVYVILQIARGMEYVHGKYVAHRDLKSCNILVRNASGAGKLEVKVADFGHSMKLASRPTLLGEEDSGVGTIRWMAPEVTSVPSGTSSYDPFKGDVFSFGMLCYEILVGRVPFYEVVQDLVTVRKKVLDGERPTLPEWTPSYLKVLIEKCWSKEASERPTFTDIVRELMKVRV